MNLDIKKKKTVIISSIIIGIICITFISYFYVYRGGLTINLNINEADCYINNKKVDKTVFPLSLRLNPGVYEIIVKKDGFLDYKKTVTIKSLRKEVINDQLKLNYDDSNLPELRIDQYKRTDITND
jgi:hypothetical protein